MFDEEFFALASEPPLWLWVIVYAAAAAVALLSPVLGT